MYSAVATAAQLICAATPKTERSVETAGGEVAIGPSVAVGCAKCDFDHDTDSDPDNVSARGAPPVHLGYPWKTTTMAVELRQELLKKAGRLLARRPYSRAEMRAKLSKWGNTDAVEGALDHMEAVGLLNDRDYAYNLAFSCIRQRGWGSARVRQYILRRQVAEDVIEKAIDRVRGDISDEASLYEYLNRHCRKSGLPSDRKGIQKLIDHLRRRGFADATILRTLRQAIPQVNWECFETGDPIAE